MWEPVLSGDSNYANAYASGVHSVTNLEFHSQLCTAKTKVWSQTDGEDDSAELNKHYWYLKKELDGIELVTGFTIWDNATGAI